MIHQEPKVGDIGLTRMSGWGRWPVRIAQYLNGDGFGDYEHAFIVVGGGRIVEAEPGGAELCGNWHDPETTMYFSPTLGWEERGEIARQALYLVGTPYSYLDYVSLALHRFHIRPAWVKDTITSSKSMICSQLVDAAYRRAGIELFSDGRYPGDATPGDLWLLSQDLEEIEWLEALARPFEEV